MKITPKRANMRKIYTMGQKSKVALANKNKKYKVDDLLKAAAQRARKKAASKTSNVSLKAALNPKNILDIKLQLLKTKSGISLVTGKPEMPNISALYRKNFKI